jgi:Ni/Co efflux regulator RcnB
MKRIALATAAALMVVGPFATTAYAQDRSGYERGDDNDRDRRGDDRRDDDRRDGDRYNRGDNDRYNRNWQPINQRQNMLENRIRAGMRSGRLSRSESFQLRAQFRDIAQVEARYRRNGLSYQERRDLDRRFDRLTANLQIALNDRDRRRG